MTGYTSFWNCRICDNRVESIDTPKNHVCDDCVRPIATILMRRAISPKLNIDSPGIDEHHWCLEAGILINAMMRRWK